ncbi:MAG TPA: endonuclease III [Candidatus Acidoferrales bacterium]|nr:endonuclease III [Candidatus Acidoferrales bacterium]
MVKSQSGSSRQALLKKRLRAIYQRLEKTYPDAKLDLNFSNPLELLVALILAAQARDDLVNEVTAELFKKYRTAADYASAPASELEQAVRRVNFYRNKTRAIQSCCRALAERFDGRVPDRLEDLLTLPGVGRKTANILLGNAFGQPAIGVDTHVMRLSQRLGFTKQTDPDKIEADLLLLVPEKQRTRFCHLLQYHGRRVCLGAKPRCPECTVRDLCPYPAKTKK